MPSREDSLRFFIYNIDEVVKSNYILAPKKISLLLKGITVSKVLLELFDFCMKDFNYQYAKECCITTESGKTKLILPADSRSEIAFIFSLLCEIDLNQVDFFKFLEKCFSGGGYSESFKRFSEEVLIPFKNRVVFAVQQMLYDNIDEVENISVRVTKSEKPVLNTEQTQKIKSLLIEAKSAILLTKLDKQQKAEVLYLYDDFDSALYGIDSDRLKLSFLGFKYAALYSKKLDVSIDEIEEILIMAGIIKTYL